MRSLRRFVAAERLHLGGAAAREGEDDPVITRHRDLRRIANAPPCGQPRHEAAPTSARRRHRSRRAGLGAKDVGVPARARLALSVTVSARADAHARLGRPPRRQSTPRHRVRRLADPGQQQRLRPAIPSGEIDRPLRETPRHPELAGRRRHSTAAAGRLLGIDWSGLHCGAGRHPRAELRHRLLSAGVNVFVVVGIIADRGDHRHRRAVRGPRPSPLAMIARSSSSSPACRHQTGLHDGLPTVGSARAVWVIMVMVFASAIWLALALMGVTAAAIPICAFRPRPRCTCSIGPSLRRRRRLRLRRPLQLRPRAASPGRPASAPSPWRSAPSASMRWNSKWPPSPPPSPPARSPWCSPRASIRHRDDRARRLHPDDSSAFFGQALLGFFALASPTRSGGRGDGVPVDPGALRVIFTSGRSAFSAIRPSGSGRDWL